VIERLMKSAAERKTAPPFTEQDFLAAQDESWRDLSRSRERDECREKLVSLGMLSGGERGASAP
jgi:thymidylate synthase (FAD)